MNLRKTITFTLNRRELTVEIDANEKLSHLLRRVGCKGVKTGCDEGNCGACTAIVDGRTIKTCIAYAWQAAGRKVETIESLGTFEQPHPIQLALVEEGAVQCGYCMPGIILSAKAMFDRNPSPDEEEMKRNLDGNLCRCTGYEKIWTALRRLSAVEERKEA